MIGFIFLIAAGLCQGSFGLGYKQYKPFSWAVFWGIYSALSVVTAFATAVILNGGTEGIGEAFTAIPVLCGALWGFSAVCFSKAITKVGMSMVYGLSMGISTIVGSVMPMIMNGSAPVGNAFITLVLGLAICVIGIVIITAAGIKRDGGMTKSGMGILLAIISGLGSGAMNVGFSSAQQSVTDITSGALSAVCWLPVLLGGCAAGILWCVGEASAKREWHTIVQQGAAKRTGILFGVSVVWYLALLLYGIAYEMLSSFIGEATWAMFNALALLVSVGWGLKTGEWKNASKALLFAGCAVLIISWVFIAV